MTIIKPRADEKGITLYCYAEPSVGKNLLGDPVRLRQVLLNILSNAVKFTSVGTVKLLASVKDVNESSITMYFEVKDSGIGMRPEQIDRVLEPFMQADEGVTRKYGGTGLGLAITKSFVEMMGGTLAVESVAGVGSKFSFEITFDTVNAPITEYEEKYNFAEIQKPTFSGVVLVCEDNYMNQRVVCDHLVKVGLRIVVAGDGKEGVYYVEERIRNGEKPFDLILMDIHMPVMDGLEAARLITATGVTTPIIALTANIMINDIELYTASGFSGHLGKPFTTQELWRCLTRYLPFSADTGADAPSSDEEALLRTLRLNFYKTNRHTFGEMKKALANDNIKLAYRIVHTLKSNAGQIGESGLQAAAAEAEGLLKNGENRLSDEQCALLEGELTVVLARLAPLYNEAEQGRRNTAITGGDALALLERLEPMLHNSNPECISLADDIHSIPHAEALARYVETFKFKQAIAELVVLKERMENEHG
jgi:CheY-like chemotaxis protein